MKIVLTRSVKTYFICTELYKRTTNLLNHSIHNHGHIHNHVHNHIHGHNIHILAQQISCHSIHGDHIHVHSHIHDHNIHSLAQHQRTFCHNIHGVHNHHIRSQYVHSHIHDHIHILARQLAQHQQISC